MGLFIDSWCEKEMRLTKNVRSSKRYTTPKNPQTLLKTICASYGRKKNKFLKINTPFTGAGDFFQNKRWLDTLGICKYLGPLTHWINK